VTAHGRGGNSQFKVGFRRGDIVPYLQDERHIDLMESSAGPD
jgi:hypothetical protein